MATRKQAREAVIQILYAKELGNEQAIEQAKYFLDEQKIRNKQQEFALALLHGVCHQESEIVRIMNVFLKTWDIERLGVIEKNILKLGIYELKQTNKQQAVVINEAIELTKSFNVQDAFRLVNGVLDSVAKTDSKVLEKLIQEYEKTQQDKQQEINIKETQISEKTYTKDNAKKAKMKSKLPTKDIITQGMQGKKTNPVHIKSVRITEKKETKQNLEKKEASSRGKKTISERAKKRTDSKSYDKFISNKMSKNLKKDDTKRMQTNGKKDSKHIKNLATENNKKDFKTAKSKISLKQNDSKTSKQQFRHSKKDNTKTTHKKD